MEEIVLLLAIIKGALAIIFCTANTLGFALTLLFWMACVYVDLTFV